MENNQKGDLISREALKNQFNGLFDLKYLPVLQEKLLGIIDDAPAVDITRICMEHYKQGRKDEKAEANGELMQSFSP